MKNVTLVVTTTKNPLGCMESLVTTKFVTFSKMRNMLEKGNRFYSMTQMATGKNYSRHKLEHGQRLVGF